MVDQLKNDEDRRRQEEEMSLLKEQNKNLLQRIEGHEGEEQTHQYRAPPSHPPTHQTPITNTPKFPKIYK